MMPIGTLRMLLMMPIGTLRMLLMVTMIMTTKSSMMMISGNSDDDNDDDDENDDDELHQATVTVYRENGADGTVKVNAATFN